MSGRAEQERLSVAGREVAISNPGKVLFPQPGYTKLDLARTLDRDGREVGAVRGVLRSLLGMMEAGTTHIGVATDHVIESFRNELWDGTGQRQPFRRWPPSSTQG